jgi:REP element-mobilizing transposase RayT
MYKDPLQPVCTYHIYNRGNNKENIFRETGNYTYFLQLWKKHIIPVADTLVYSLLPNHFHFLVRLKEENTTKVISKSFSNCFNAYAKSFNKVYGRTGSLFQERFGRKLINNDSYFTHIIFYIHANAQKHGLIRDFTTYPHSSYQSFLSENPTLLQRKEVLDWFGGKDAFIKFHKTNKEELAAYLCLLAAENL